MNILLVNPEYPDNFWSFKPLLGYLSKKSLQTPLGLIAVAALLPKSWHLRLLDLNLEPLRTEDLKWADYVFLTGMIAQIASVREIIKRCRAQNVKTVAGGPLFTSFPEDYPEVDHLILFEAETNLPPFLRDLQAGAARRRYASTARPNLAACPPPRWDLLRWRDYLSASIEYSRGCPFHCEFCSVRFFLGNRIRSKTRDQILAELEVLYTLGWRGDVTFVDDNLIGNPRRIKSEILPGIIDWMARKNHPFSFTTNVTINLADDDDLMALMIRAGFETLFIGIESPAAGSLQECAKQQNQKRNLAADLQRLLHRGFQIRGGFIVGFDQDPPGIFQNQIDFIQNSGIGFPHLSLLIATPGTALYARLKKQDRLLPENFENFGYYSTNFEPARGFKPLLAGYRQVVEAVYSPAGIFQRLEVFFRHYRPPEQKPSPFHARDLLVLARSLWGLGVRDGGRSYFWKLAGRHWKTPQTFAVALGLWMMGQSVRQYHQRSLPCAERQNSRRAAPAAAKAPKK